MSYTSKAVDFMSISTIAQFGQIVVVTSPYFRKYRKLVTLYLLLVRLSFCVRLVHFS